MTLQQNQINAVNRESKNEEVKIGITILFKQLTCADGSTMNLTASQVNDIVSRMYRRVFKLTTKKISYNDENGCNALILSISGYCNTEQQTYASLKLGVPISLGRLEFAGLVEGVLMESPFVKNVTYSDLSVEMSE